MQMVFKSSNVEIYIWNVENNKYDREAHLGDVKQRIDEVQAELDKKIDQQ